MNPDQVRALIAEELGKILGSQTFEFNKSIKMGEGRNFILGTQVGTMIGTTDAGDTYPQKLGFFGTAPVVQQTVGSLSSAADIGQSLAAYGLIRT